MLQRANAQLRAYNPVSNLVWLAMGDLSGSQNGITTKIMTGSVYTVSPTVGWGPEQKKKSIGAFSAGLKGREPGIRIAF